MRIFIFSFSSLPAKEPQMLRKGRLLVEETFDKALNPEKWKVAGEMKGGKDTLDNIRIWEGLPNPEWDANRSAWIAKKDKRPHRDFAADPEFEFKFRVANLRRRLRTENDPEYKVIIVEMQEKTISFVGPSGVIHS